MPRGALCVRRLALPFAMRSLALPSRSVLGQRAPSSLARLEARVLGDERVAVEEADHVEHLADLKLATDPSLRYRVAVPVQAHVALDIHAPRVKFVDVGDMQGQPAQSGPLRQVEFVRDALERAAESARLVIDLVTPAT